MQEMRAGMRLPKHPNLVGIATLQHTATHCNTLQHSCRHTLILLVNTRIYLVFQCNTLQLTAKRLPKHPNLVGTATLQHTATHCNTLQHADSICSTFCKSDLMCDASWFDVWFLAKVISFVTLYLWCLMKWGMMPQLPHQVRQAWWVIDSCIVMMAHQVRHHAFKWLRNNTSVSVLCASSTRAINVMHVPVMWHTHIWVMWRMKDACDAWTMQWHTHVWVTCHVKDGCDVWRMPVAYQARISHINLYCFTQSIAIWYVLVSERQSKHVKR